MLSDALGVAIGIVFVFMLFSLFLSTALEAVAALLKLRGRALRVALARLIDDPAHLPGWGGFGLLDDAVRAWRRLTGSRRTAEHEPASAGPGGELVADAVNLDAPEMYEGATEAPGGDCVPRTPLSFTSVFCHPLVAGAQAHSKPSYVSAQNFASAVLHVLRGDASGRWGTDLASRVGALPPGPLRDALQTILQEAQGDPVQVKVGIERWFEHAMDRLSGEYKRFSQAATFLVGLALAVAYNVDAVAIAQRLYVDPILRDAIVKQATEYVDAVPQKAAGAPPARAASALATEADAQERFDETLEAAEQARRKLLEAIPFVATREKDYLSREYFGRHPAAPIGWLFTAIAGMLGAPFWFELLQKLVNLRGAGPKPAPATPKAGAVQ